jgi:hypothetical protein
MKHLMEAHELPDGRVQRDVKEASPRLMDAAQTPGLRAWRTSSIISMRK